VHCDTCHTADPKNLGPNGRPRLKFDDDSKPEKQMARIMYKMTEDMKKNYIEKVADMDKMDSPAAPLTCGTCHRGHLDPEEFVPPHEEGPRGPGGPPPAGAMPNMPDMQH
jgi:cytochrome c553